MNKKFLLITLIFFLVSNSALSYEYYLYDPTTNKTHKAIMYTVGLAGENPNDYYISLLVADEWISCQPGAKTNTNAQGLMGGLCYLNDEIFKWREIRPNTYLRERQEVINERMNQGYIYVPPQK